MSALLAILARRHAQAAAVSPPVVANSAAWFDMVNQGAQPDTKSWTVPADTTLLLCLTAAVIYGAGSAWGAPSWGGAPMTAIAEHKVGINAAVKAWLLASPPAGAGSLTWSPYTMAAHGQVNPCLVALRSAAAAGILHATGGAEAGASPISTSITPAAATDLVVDVVGRIDVDALAAGAGQTLRHEGGYRLRGGFSTRVPSGVSPQAMAWSWTGGAENWAHLLLSVPGLPG